MVSPRDQLAARLSRKEGRDADFDTKATADLLRGIKLPPTLRQRVYDHAEQRKRGQPRIKDFREVFPDFPVYITVDRRENLRDTAGLGQLFPAQKMASQPFVQEFFKLRAARHYEIAGRPVVVLIRWPSMAGTVALHQIPYDSDLPGVSIRLTIPGDPAERLAVEPVEQLFTLLSSYGVIIS